MTKLTLFRRVKLGLALLAMILLVGACRTLQAVEGDDPAMDEGASRATLDASRITPMPTTGTQLGKSDLEGGSDMPGASRTPDAQMAPDFRLPDLGGQMWTLAQFRDRPVMLFFWATW